MKTKESKVTGFVVRFLKQGLTAEKIALCVSLGVVLGLFPILGSTTVLCALVALPLGLNLPLIQTVNYLMTPLHLLMVIPWIRVGERLFSQPELPMTLSRMMEMLDEGFLQAVDVLWQATWHAVAAWALLAPFATTLLYFILLPGLRRLERNPS